MSNASKRGRPTRRRGDRQDERHGVLRRPTTSWCVFPKTRQALARDHGANVTTSAGYKRARTTVRPRTKNGAPNRTSRRTLSAGTS
ncbi:hypothetical protein MRX96_008771 [Rhipicephalus microplus]